ncbi:hypothetical protein NEF87_004634 [Candidatus Lokiarchaeum ossiferum]|uniref:Uncharacterized protein n=1 Tax=Candidatus Lokiarchaeum ossiferum TaxID=2951803 RepID=A0ABY6I0K2_9ARCH|nr:hypothetical protein NEF87_004634 [Candidatus Lokiarchaeum sp. B-35]
MIKKQLFRIYTEHDYTRINDTKLCLELLEEIAKDNGTDISHIYSVKIYPIGLSALILHGPSNPLTTVEHILIKKDYSQPAGLRNYECIGKLYKKVWLSPDKTTVFAIYRIESSQPLIYI